MADVADHIKDLIPDPSNRRVHSPRNIGLIVESLQAVGAARSIVIDEDNVIRAGNGTVDAAAEAGITKLLVVDTDGDALVAVRRSGLTDAQKRALALYDNRATELSRWDGDALQQDLAAGLDLSPFFTSKELAHALKTTPVDLTTPEPMLTTPTTTCPACGHSFVPL